MIMGSIYGPEELPSMVYFKVNVFKLENDMEYKKRITFDRSLYTSTESSMRQAFDERKFKLFWPKIFEPPRNFYAYEDGKVSYVSTKISIQKYIDQMTDLEVQEDVQQKMDKIEKMGLKEALPEKSEPHIMLVEHECQKFLKKSMPLAGNKPDK